MTTKHTPTPWTQAVAAGSGIPLERIMSGRGVHVGTISSCDTSLDTDIANAAFIVRAVNSHDAMREALADAARWIECDAEDGPLYPLRLGRKDMIDRCRAALALAEEE